MMRRKRIVRKELDHDDQLRMSHLLPRGFISNFYWVTSIVMSQAVPGPKMIILHCSFLDLWFLYLAVSLPGSFSTDVTCVRNSSDMF